MTREEKARQEIDRRLVACGWLVQDHKAMNIMAGPGVAVREFPLKTGFADYLLYVDAKVIGLIEAKPEGHTLDLVALVRHAIHPKEQVVAVSEEVEENYRTWLAEQENAGAKFAPEQRQWLDAIKNHIAQSLAIEQSDFDEVPFNRMGGLGKVYQLFGDRLPKLLDELNDRLAA